MFAPLAVGGQELWPPVKFSWITPDVYQSLWTLKQYTCSFLSNLATNFKSLWNYELSQQSCLISAKPHKPQGFQGHLLEFITINVCKCMLFFISFVFFFLCNYTAIPAVVIFSTYKQGNLFILMTN